MSRLDEIGRFVAEVEAEDWPERMCTRSVMLAMMRDLLTVVASARKIGPPECDLCYEEECTGNDEGRCPCDDVCHPWQMSARMELREALVRLDAVTGGETS